MPKPRKTWENRGKPACLPDPRVFGDAPASRAVGALTHLCKWLSFPNPSHNEQARLLARALIWGSAAGACAGCLSPIWLDGSGWGTAGGACVMAILGTWGLTRLCQPWLEKQVSLVPGWFLPR